MLKKIQMGCHHYRFNFSPQGFNSSVLKEIRLSVCELSIQRLIYSFRFIFLSLWQLSHTNVELVDTIFFGVSMAKARKPLKKYSIIANY